ncbi:hypothetical protein ACOBR2_18230 [Telmatobacter bradus]|uniref:hypothetical protein n=1 Tax=Telmatobacter bradus TaxID=474953 RepID=UPI003B435923
MLIERFVRSVTFRLQSERLKYRFSDGSKGWNQRDADLLRGENEELDKAERNW